MLQPHKNRHNNSKIAAETALQARDFSRLIHIFQQCLTEHPSDPSLHTDLGKAYLAIGNRAYAKQHLLAALQCDPHRTETLYQLALFYRQEGNFVDSIQYFQKALRVNPLIAEVHQQLANTYTINNQFELARTHYHEALQYGAPPTDIHRNLGMLYFNDSHWEKAATHLEPAFAATPDALIGLPLGQALLNLGKAQAAEAVYKQILQLNPDCHDAHHNLGILRLNAQDNSNALHHFRTALALQPDNATARHMVSALSHATDIDTPSHAYTKALFEQYAPYYDAHMKALDYQVPLAIRNLLGLLLPPHASNLTVLDLGCGTGQCGLYCRDLAYTLTGVDLSAHMLAAAKNLGAYDTLIEAPLESYLSTVNTPFDVIMAAEVLNYVGNLSAIWPPLIQALKPGGYCVFTTENPSHAAHCPTGYRLEPTGRFSHDPETLQHFIESHHNLRVVHTATLHLRQSTQAPTMGRLWAITRS